MSHENRISKSAYLFLVMLMSSGICQTLYTSLFMTADLSGTVFIAVILFTLLYFVIFRNKITTLAASLVLFAASAAGALYLIFIIGITDMGNWLNNFYNWFINVCNGYTDETSPLYANLILLLLVSFVTLLVFIFSIKAYNFYVLTCMMFCVFFVQLQFEVFVSDISFILSLFSFLLYYFFHILKRRSKESTYVIENKLMYLVCILPVCILVIAFSLSLPVGSNRIEISWLDEKFDNAANYFFEKDRADFDYFSIEATGFGNNSRLGGNIKLNKAHVMNVKSESSKLYLKASSKAFYNGHGWYDNNEQLTQLGTSRNNYTIQLNQDAEEFCDGIFIETGSLDNDEIFKPVKTEIEFENIKTKSIFVPLKTNAITFRNFQTLFSDNEQMISSSGKQSRGFIYTAEYNNLMLNSDKLKSILRKSYKGYFSNLLEKYYAGESPSFVLNMSGLVKIPYTDRTSKLFNERIISNKEMKDFISRTYNIYERYTQLPEEVTPRVRQLAQNLTKTEYNNYDKAKAVESYLSSNFPYTLSPGRPPIDKDFVDYFLFEGKKGYCTYYATAMTVLLRCIDIPARFVEGYVMPPKADNGIFKVTNEQAHAWVEVYLEGFGWIPFEPTASFTGKMYYDTTITSQAFEDKMPDSGYSSYLDYLEMLEKNKNKAGAGYDGNISDLSEENEAGNVFLVIIIILTSLGMFLLAFILLIIINTVKHNFAIRKIRRLEPNKSVLEGYSYILKVLHTRNIFYEPGETPAQFGKRIEKTFDFKGYSLNKTDFTRITSHYINARYSKVLLKVNDREDMLYFINVLLDMTADQAGRFKSIMSRYILGKF
ncbi:transglutaminase superfamily protein [Ruminiclostridium sufflavum DSM 19573]|uniref:Transglutaminase superfamily protein n=1 Tax=Ruminiclostridium sufflavum DSM 19573 TaxID=1121337 RepID=A0A318XJQ8_9FIRM|nr:transglutaminase-like domain-containing protein [Ruminiclostridium sufflavum]PYG87560.1 transglutaminase superfamily protein [Ruminiclostridium sufflavum DSM 19573]